MEVKVLRARYPQGAERVMVYEITGKVLKAGMLPADVGVIFIKCDYDIVHRQVP